MKGLLFSHSLFCHPSRFGLFVENDVPKVRSVSFIGTVAYLFNSSKEILFTIGYAIEKF
jgi:hypothetical protein